MKIDISHLKFDERGLIPAIVQDVTTDKVLMLAYMNGQSLARTVETGYTWFWSRSRQELWNKGATSGNLQKVKSIVYDCDGDTLLVRVVQKGVACHEGNYSCFSYPLWNAGSGENLPVTYSDLPTVVDELYRKLTNEMGDLWYHCLVLLAYHGITPAQMLQKMGELAKNKQHE